MKNRYREQEDYIEIECQYKGEILYVKIDKEDLPRVQKLSGTITLRKTRMLGTPYYAQSSKYVNGKQTHTLLHRFILDTPPHLQVDHIEHDGLDNRKRKLKNCTHAENAKNQSPIRRKHIGKKNGCYIRRRKDCDRYELTVYEKHTWFYGGLHNTEEKAREAYYKNWNVRPNLHTSTT